MIREVVFRSGRGRTAEDFWDIRAIGDGSGATNLTSGVVAVACCDVSGPASLRAREQAE